MTSTYKHHTPVQVKRLADAAEMGEVAGREYRLLLHDLTWDRDNWHRLIEQIQVNPYETCEPDMDEQERATLHRRWKQHFDLGDHAQQAETRWTP